MIRAPSPQAFFVAGWLGRECARHNASLANLTSSDRLAFPLRLLDPVLVLVYLLRGAMGSYGRLREGLFSTLDSGANGCLVEPQ